MSLLPYSMCLHTLAAVLSAAVGAHPSWLLLSDSRVKEWQVTVHTSKKQRGESPLIQIRTSSVSWCHPPSPRRLEWGSPVSPSEWGPLTSRSPRCIIPGGPVLPRSYIRTGSDAWERTLLSRSPVGDHPGQAGGARPAHSDALHTDGARHAPEGGPAYNHLHRGKPEPVRANVGCSGSRTGNASLSSFDSPGGDKGGGCAVWLVRPGIQRSGVARDTHTPTSNPPFPETQSARSSPPSGAAPYQARAPLVVSFQPAMLPLKALRSMIDTGYIESVGGPRGRPSVRKN